jgi:hypothetical protein
MRLLFVIVSIALFTVAGCSKDDDKSGASGDQKTDKAKDPKAKDPGATPLKDDAKRNAAKGPKPTMSTAGGTTTKAPADDVKLADPDGAGADDECMKKCMRENQARAVGADVIESDCQKQCAKK